MSTQTKAFSLFGGEQAGGQVLYQSIGPKEKGEAEPSVPSSSPNLPIQ